MFFPQFQRIISITIQKAVIGPGVFGHQQIMQL